MKTLAHIVTRAVAPWLLVLIMVVLVTNHLEKNVDKEKKAKRKRRKHLPNFRLLTSLIRSFETFDSSFFVGESNFITALAFDAAGLLFTKSWWRKNMEPEINRQRMNIVASMDAGHFAIKPTIVVFGLKEVIVSTVEVAFDGQRTND
uniref:Uncharacterized protein n=1 Tax=Romanomermis culicivorax TaxID=13658 RepID=A0A915L986_ROMCU